MTARPDPAPDLDQWLDEPAVQVVHRRRSRAEPDRLWDAARSLRLDQTRLLGRLVRWRIPGASADSSFEDLFTSSPFLVLEDRDMTLLSGFVGRIWSIRRDYPQLRGAAEYRDWDRAGTSQVLFANWVRARDDGGADLHSETRVRAFGVQGRLGLASVRPLIAGFQQLVATDAMAATVRLAER